MGTFGDFGDLGFVATWGMARSCGPCPDEGIRAEKVLRTRNKTLEWYIRIQGFKAHVSRCRVAEKRAAST